ncbi:MAG: folate family ECF transporter S component, partial [Candidatus Izemoplasmatales bacterium]
MKNNNLQKLIFAALMVAIGIILSNILSISYPPSSTIIRIGFGYLPLFLVSILLGPKIGIAAAIVQDLFGWILFGYQFGPFFPGYTLNAVLYGVIPYIIYNLKTKVKRLFVYMNFGLLSILLGLGVWALFRIDWIFEIVEKKLAVGMDFSPLIIYLILGLGILGVLAGFMFIYLNKDEDD